MRKVIRTLKDESHTQHEHADYLALFCRETAHDRFQLNAMYKSRVTDAKKRINLCVVMVKILNKTKRQGKTTNKGF